MPSIYPSLPIKNRGSSAEHLDLKVFFTRLCAAVAEPMMVFDRHNGARALYRVEKAVNRAFGWFNSALSAKTPSWIQIDSKCDVFRNSAIAALPHQELNTSSKALFGPFAYQLRPAVRPIQRRRGLAHGCSR